MKKLLYILLLPLMGSCSGRDQSLLNESFTLSEQTEDSILNFSQKVVDVDISSSDRTPSGATCVINGGSDQGTTSLKDKDNNTFETLFPKENNN